MCQINHLPPDRMTPEQRRIEIASLLAAGLARLRCGKRAPIAEITEKRQVSLGFSGDQSVHDNPSTRKPEFK